MLEWCPIRKGWEGTEGAMSSLLDACYLLVVPSQQSEHLRRPVGVDTCTYVPPSRVGLAAYCGCQSRASASPLLGQHGRSWISQPDCQVPNLHKRATLACLEQHFEQVSIYIYGILCSITSRSTRLTLLVCAPSACAARPDAAAPPPRSLLQTSMEI